MKLRLLAQNGPHWKNSCGCAAAGMIPVGPGLNHHLTNHLLITFSQVWSAQIWPHDSRFHLN